MAAEAGISRRCLATWYARWRAHGENGLLDRSRLATGFTRVAVPWAPSSPPRTVCVPVPCVRRHLPGHRHPNFTGITAS
ncbi:helix-turn-helix domain-containing protein [Streptomyces hygroscopicus subsp. hygroscopicus]|nr:helix-turn-helix domain-containing protein [Streptomyces hygroscopicus subsp. hygroscopicus]